LPWSSDTFAFTQPDRRIPPGFRTAIIDPSVEDDQGQVIARLGALRLFGSNELTDSLLQLMPGKTALIRVQVRWAVQADEQRAVANALSKGSVYFVAAFAVPEENHDRCVPRLDSLRRRTMLWRVIEDQPDCALTQLRRILARSSHRLHPLGKSPPINPGRFRPSC
jgi:hypothetical protein